MRRVGIACAFFIVAVGITFAARLRASAPQAVNTEQSEALKRNTAAHRHLHSAFQSGKPLTDSQRRTFLPGTPYETSDQARLKASMDPLAAFVLPLWCESQAIVQGQVVAAAADVTDDRSFVFTDYAFRVEAVEKGSGIAPNEVITITRPGGEIKTAAGTIGADVANLEPLLPGTSYVVFLRSKAEGVWLADVRLGTFLTDGANARSTSDRAPAEIFQPGVSLNALTAAINGADAGACSAKEVR
jgi:hypothetical protein